MRILGETSSSYQPTSDGLYRVYVTNANISACVGASSLMKQYDAEFNASLSSERATYEGGEAFTLIASPAASGTRSYVYNWDDAPLIGTQIDHYSNYSNPDEVTGFYNVVVGVSIRDAEDINGLCTRSTSIQITIHEEIEVSIADINLEKEDLFYPNPCSEVLHLNTKHEEYSIVIYAANGDVVFQAENTLEINVSEWESGMYLLSITSEGETVTRKFVKE